jgi:hypothetical protein
VQLLRLQHHAWCGAIALATGTFPGRTYCVCCDIHQHQLSDGGIGLANLCHSCSPVGAACMRYQRSGVSILEYDRHSSLDALPISGRSSHKDVSAVHAVAQGRRAGVMSSLPIMLLCSSSCLHNARSSIQDAAMQRCRVQTCRVLHLPSAL